MINIYSIKEIVEATNGFLTKKSEKTSKKNEFDKTYSKIHPYWLLGTKNI